MTRLYNKMKDHRVTIYAVAKAGGWSWQQVAAWVKGSQSMHLETFKKLQVVMREYFGVEIDLSDMDQEGGRR